MTRPIHFELMVDDPESAAAFYADVFGWDVKKWSGPMDYWLVTTGDEETPGIGGGIARSELPGTPARTVNIIGVPSVDDYVARVTAAGGVTMLPKMVVPGVGWLAYCMDPAGIVFGMMQEDPAAG
ncbi:MAG TPA: VOC family protein [Chthonomonadales bacterium]|nr:VOC family protein [Chthonomonadales bacterium]